MAFEKDQDEKKNASGKKWDSEKMLQLYIYNHMKKKNLHEVAEVFAKEANIEMFELVESDDGLLAEWWELFWPTFCSRMSNKAEGADEESSVKRSLETGLSILTGLRSQGAGSSQQAPMESEQRVFPNIPMIKNELVGNDFTSMRESQPLNLLLTIGASQRRAGRDPISAEYDNVMGQLATRNMLGSQAFAYERSLFPPVSLSDQIPFTMLSKDNPNHRRLPTSSEPPIKATKDPTNDVAVGSMDEIDSTHLEGLNSTSAASAYVDVGLSESFKNMFKNK